MGRPDLDASDAVRRIALSLVRELGRGRRRLLRTPGAEALHDYRVALRRLRTVVQALEGRLAAAETPRLGKELRRVARGTGPARDLQVLRRVLEALKDRVPPRLAHVLSEALQREQQRADAKLREVLRPKVHATLVELSRAVFQAPKRPLADAPRSFAALGREILGPLVEVARRNTIALEDPPSSRSLHELRIALKRVRYVVEAFEEGLPYAVVRRRTTLRRLQDELGYLHDADVHAQWIVRTVVRAERRRLGAYGRALEGREVDDLRRALAELDPDPAIRQEADALLAHLAAERARALCLCTRLLRQRGRPGLERLHGLLEPRHRAAAARPREAAAAAEG